MNCLEGALRMRSGWEQTFYATKEKCILEIDEIVSSVLHHMRKVLMFANSNKRVVRVP